MNHEVEQFFSKFLSSPKGNSPQDIEARVRHWIDAANHPEQYTQDKSPYAVAARRKSARQNLRKLLVRHPHIAGQIMRETNREAEQ